MTLTIQKTSSALEALSCGLMIVQAITLIHPGYHNYGIMAKKYGATLKEDTCT